MFSNKDVLETIAMVQEEHLDIRTITMGLSLLGCIRDTAEETARKVYDLVCKKAENIVKTATDTDLIKLKSATYIQSCLKISFAFSPINKGKLT